MESLEARLQKAREEKESAEQLERKLRATKEDLEQARRNSKELEKVLHKEKRDIEKLQGLSLSNLFATVLGSKEEKMDKERQEYLAAELRFETALNLVKTLASQVEELEQQLLPLKDIKRKYQAILKEKEERLKTRGGKAAEALFALAEEEGRLVALGRELQEAQEAASQGIGALGDLADCLDSAAGWGTWDMLGGGMISTAIKHSKIDGAKGQAMRAQRYLERLSRELADVQIESNLRIDIGGLATFADYFFDGLIADWVVQSRINDAKSRVTVLRKRVASIERSLSTEIQKTAARVREIKRQRAALVEQG
jgi:hypothetical protein